MIPSLVWLAAHSLTAEDAVPQHVLRQQPSPLVLACRELPRGGCCRTAAAEELLLQLPRGFISQKSWGAPPSLVLCSRSPAADTGPLLRASSRPGPPVSTSHSMKLEELLAVGSWLGKRTSPSHRQSPSLKMGQLQAGLTHGNCRKQTWRYLYSASGCQKAGLAPAAPVTDSLRLLRGHSRSALHLAALPAPREAHRDPGIQKGSGFRQGLCLLHGEECLRRSFSTPDGTPMFCGPVPVPQGSTPRSGSSLA